MSVDILNGIERAAGMLLVAGFVYISYKASRDFAEKKKDIVSWKRYVFTVGKWILTIALIALVAASIAGKGGCDSFDNCTDPDPNPAPITETWVYFFVLLIVPAMIGLYRATAKSEERPT